jgi:hypothetical protein
MKKTVFLMLSAMAVVLCGCSTGSGYGLLKTAGPGNAMIDAQTDPTLAGAHERGVCMPISAHSSLNVDVECILEYVQGDAPFDAADAQNDALNPWVRLNYSF